MSRTSETTAGAGEYRCGVCENCRANGPIEFPNCQETPSYRCGACANCRAKGPIQFPNCHEVDEVRCSCGKCLAKDGKIKCSRCDELTEVPVRPRMLDEARHTAFFLSALAISAQILQEHGKPVTVTLKRTHASMGYVQHAPATGFLYSQSELKARLVVLLTGLAAEQALGNVTTGPSSTFEQAMQLARTIVSYGMVDGWDKDPDGAARSLLESAMAEATSFVAANRAAIDSVAAVLLYKGELTGDDVARLVPAGVNGTGGGAASEKA